EQLRGLITEHVQHTGSSRGEEILANWQAFSAKFGLVNPKSSDDKDMLVKRSGSRTNLLNDNLWNINTNKHKTDTQLNLV
ncbi:hypothetical protein, partial [Enterobacter hormaechei]